MQTLLSFLDRIEGSGYGGMAEFEIARIEAKEAVAEIGRLKNQLLVTYKLMSIPIPDDTPVPDNALSNLLTNGDLRRNGG